MPALTDKSPARFILLAQPLWRYISTYYFLNTGHDEAEQKDFLYPEWATVHAQSMLVNCVGCCGFQSVQKGNRLAFTCESR